MGKGLRENPPTLTMDCTWSPLRKQYVLTVSWSGGTGRHGVVRHHRLVNEERPEITAEGAELLARAVMEEYAAWLF